MSSEFSLPEFGLKLKEPSLFIGKGLLSGIWADAQSGKTFPVWEPSTGKVLKQCADFSKGEFVQAIEAAEQGYKDFHKSTTAKERSGILRAWGNSVLANAKDCESSSKRNTDQLQLTQSDSGHDSVLGER